ncbi:hypothetical protein ACQEU8_19380 [Streptomyces sp. CA-250714]|uniref:hypothetical protein n=1 Tax=Streptomyces sp. CA-250714 TaxID=3240060 RepID=UPI003D91AE08
MLGASPVIRSAQAASVWPSLHPPSPQKRCGECFEAASAAELAEGREPELDRIAFAGSSRELADLSGPHADYLNRSWADTPTLGAES